MCLLTIYTRCVYKNKGILEIKAGLSMMVKISVIMPIYNVEAYLRQSLGSVLNQTMKDLELICINDGSTDDSLNILNEYAVKDSRIKIINQKNSGAGYSRNVGIKHSQGEYLFFMDSDDWIDENFLQDVYSSAISANADIVETTKSYNCYSNDKKILFNKRNAKGFTANGQYFRRDVVWDKIFRRDFVNSHQITYPNGLSHNDAYFLLQSLYYKPIIVRNDTATYYHNKANESSIRFKPSDKKLLSQEDMFLLEIDFLNTHFFTFDDYRHNYEKLYRTAKRKRKYIKGKENKIEYDKKLKQIKEINKYPFSELSILFKRLFSSRFREEFQNSRANPKDYPNILKKWYYKKLGKPLNLDNPTTFNEKIQWLKLNDSTPEKTLLADKYLVREYIKEKIGEEYLVPLLGVYSKFDDIDFAVLPDKFVLKCNHGSSMNAVITDKSSINIKKLKTKFDTWMRENFGFVKGLQLHYNHIPHKIIAEEYISPLDDYKFYCYNGHCEHILHKYEAGRKSKYCNFDIDLNCLPLSPKSSVEKIKLPDNFDKMLTLAEKLAEKFVFVRVDFYISNKKIYFSELTFTPSSGVNTYTEEWDKKLGKFLNIEELK